MGRHIEIFNDGDALAVAAAEKWIALSQSLEKFHVALSGGTTPKRLFQILAKPEYAKRINWNRCFIFFGDERFVPSEHVDNNYRMACEYLLTKVPIPAQNLFPIATSFTDAVLAAQAYEKVLRGNVPQDAGLPCFDLVFLGLGADGHTASLFPGTEALAEQHKFATAVHVTKMNSWRITLTYPVLNNAKHVMFLVEGSSKRDIINDILQKYQSELHYPAQGVKPRGELYWYLDRDAAAELR